MPWIDIVVCAALLQYFVFSSMTGRARGRYGVKAPATTGHEMFERAYRVQMNTLEMLVIFLPATYLAARYWSGAWVAGLGVVYLVGRVIYARAYLSDPASRSLGFGISAFPALVLLGGGLVGALLAALR